MCSNIQVSETNDLSRPGTIASIACNLLSCRTDFQIQRMYIDIAYEWMTWFNQRVEVCIFMPSAIHGSYLLQDHTRDIRLCEERVPAFMLAEIAFLVTLSSADNNVSVTSAHCLSR